MPLRLDLATLIGCSPLFGHELADKSPMGAAQDRALLRDLQTQSTIACPAAGWAFGALDLMVSGAGDDLRFYPAELNGTGMGGLLRMPTSDIDRVLAECTAFGRGLSDIMPLVLLAFGGDNPPAQVHDRVLVADAIAAGLRENHGRVHVTASLDETPFPDMPTVAIVPLSRARRHIAAHEGVARWSGRPITAVFHDRLADALVDDGTSPAELITMNRCHRVCTDKGLFSHQVNRLLDIRRFDHFPDQLVFSRADDATALREAVREMTGQGRGAVVKPHGGSQGKGIVFVPRNAGPKLIDDALGDVIANRSGFPYTVCELIDGNTIGSGELAGHRFDLRLVVYAADGRLYAVPTNARVAKSRYEPGSTDPKALITNISAFKGDGPGAVDLPLTHPATLARLDLKPDQLAAACTFATAIVRQCIEQTSS